MNSSFIYFLLVGFMPGRILIYRLKEKNLRYLWHRSWFDNKNSILWISFFEDWWKSRGGS